MTYTSCTWHDVADEYIAETEIADENAATLSNSCHDTIDEQCTIEDMQSIIEAMPQSRLHVILDIMWESEDEYKSDLSSEQPSTEDDKDSDSVLLVQREQT